MQVLIHIFIYVVINSIFIIYSSVGNDATLIIIGVNNNMDKIIEAIENYIQLVTSRKASALDDCIVGLEGLVSDLDSIISDAKEVVEGRI